MMMLRRVVGSKMGMNGVGSWERPSVCAICSLKVAKGQVDDAESIGRYGVSNGGELSARFAKVELEAVELLGELV
jgi:hypothetical protein